MSKAAMNLQDSFLNQVRRENSEVRVLLVNGATLRGVVKGFDNFTVILSDRNGQHLIYKHAIAQLMCHRNPVHHQEGDDSTGSKAEQQHDAVTAGVAEAANDGAEQNSQNASKQKKDGFNTIDFSKLKL
jgi:host factor-I protein